MERKDWVTRFRASNLFSRLSEGDAVRLLEPMFDLPTIPGTASGAETDKTADRCRNSGKSTVADQFEVTAENALVDFLKRLGTTLESLWSVNALLWGTANSDSAAPKVINQPFAEVLLVLVARFGWTEKQQQSHRNLAAFAAKQAQPVFVAPSHGEPPKFESGSVPQETAWLPIQTERTVFLLELVFDQPLNLIASRHGTSSLHSDSRQAESLRAEPDHPASLGIAPLDRQSVLGGLQATLDFVSEWFRCTNAGAVDHPVIPRFEEIDAAVSQIKRRIVTLLENEFRKYADVNFGSLSANQEFCRRLHRILEENGLRVRCPECGTPAILRCQGSRKTSGQFVFDHTFNTRRTFHGGTSVVPRLTIVPKPERKARSSAS